MTGKLFLSHTHLDKQEAQTLRRALEDSGVGVWEDTLELRAGDSLGDLEAKVMGSRGLLLLWTRAANESEWVEREAGWAREARKTDPDFRLLVVLRDGGRVSARRLLGEELVFIPVEDAVEEAVPEIRRSLGVLAPSGRAAAAPARAPLLEELVISFSDARIDESAGRRRAAGRFRVHHLPAEGAGSRGGWRELESPLGPIEIEEIRWYLERYPGWPYGTFRDRAMALEAKLPEWGRALFDQTLGQSVEQTAAWRRATGRARRVVVEVEDTGGDGGSAAAAALLALPWELLADEEGYLFEGGLRARVVRRITRQASKPPLPPVDRLRVLLVLARPEEPGVSFLDPRASARPLIEALDPLGHRAELEVLSDGTFAALSQALTRADDAGRPFHVVHFDGHGIYDRTAGLGRLCFEHAADAAANKLERRAELIDADTLGALLRDRRVPLFVLEACQTAMAEEKATASVAARLLRAGVGSVLAMTHAVLVETARRFVGRFYQGLAAGERIGSAMVEAQRQLRADPGRGEVGGYGELRLEDWFVPVLFQEEDGDLQLLGGGGEADAAGLADQRRVREGELPPAPAHGFVGRARELLAVQRLLRDHRSLAVLGESGQGKTALAVECARWLLELRRFERVAFVGVEDRPDARLVLERLGRQLVPGYSVATEEGAGAAEERLRKARLPVERVLGERRVLLVVDNVESLISGPGPAADDAGEVFALLSGLARKGETRLLLTSREAPPAPLGGPVFRLDRLAKREGRELVTGVLARLGRAPAGKSGAQDEEWVDRLVEQVGGNARSLVLLAPLVTEQGLQVTAESMKAMMAELEARHPGARELSLLASVRLSLDRLPEPARTQVRGLAVFHGAMHFQSLARVIQVKDEETLDLCRQLVALGLANAEGPYLMPDPALGAAVADEVSLEERAGMERRWIEAALDLIAFLYDEQRGKDPRAAAVGTRIALTDLLAAVTAAERVAQEGGLSPHAVMNALTRLQQLVQRSGKVFTLAQLGDLRQRLAKRLYGWSHARFVSARAEIEQRDGTGDVAGALKLAHDLKERADAEGEAYPDASYDRALATALVGRMLDRAGRFEEALRSLDDAERRFFEMAAAGLSAAGAMVAVLHTERGDSLKHLWRLDEAAQSYQSSITLAEKLGAKRIVAVGNSQLGDIRRLQGRYQEALRAIEESRQTFVDLNEVDTVGRAWHRIGMIYHDAQQFDRAEDAFQQSLRIEVELGDKAGQAATLHHLGLLYGSSGRLEDAAKLLRQATTIHDELGDTFSEAFSLNNLAEIQRTLGRLDEARESALRAIELYASFGHAAKPWTTWSILHDIEAKAGRSDMAMEARSHAIELFAQYRRDGGAAQHPIGQLIAAVGEALRSRQLSHARDLIPPPERWQEDLLVRDALVAIIAGSRDPALAQDPRLDYDAAAELILLLESFGTAATA
jgi:tetratricopeptide (TPR) repeat protein